MRLVVRARCVVALTLSANVAAAQRSTRIKTTITKKGTVIQSHLRTAKCEETDNWSSKPNVNPYTGKAGTRDPYLTPASRRKK